LKDDPLTAWYPVVLVSGNDELEIIKTESSAGACLQKPFETDKLVEMVKALIK
jgi:FixJ family two-component response regulator